MEEKRDNSKILFLGTSCIVKEVVLPELKIFGYASDDLFRQCNIFFRGIRHYWFKWNMPKSFWYGKWKKKLSQIETVILFDCAHALKAPYWIHKHYPKIRIIYWYWNPVEEQNMPHHFVDIKNGNTEFWSFDSEDCRRYGLKKNIQFYPLGRSVQNTIVEKENDLFFIGIDKGRKNFIKDIAEAALNQNLKCDIRILSKKDHMIPYRDVCGLLQKSRGILEVLQKKQSGCSLRTMESLFFSVKLVTNNVGIKEEISFYNQNNIFVIGEDDISTLGNFLRSEYDHSVDIYREQYNIETWIKNFFCKR